MKNKNAFALLLSLIVALGLVAAGCSSSDDSTSESTTPTTAASSSEDTGSSDLETLRVGVVPSLDLGVVSAGEKQGYFEEEGLKLEISPVDAGPTIVTGIVADQYDIGWTAYAPPLLAIGEGAAPLKLVSNSSVQGPEGDNGGTLIRKDSGIESWKDLAGKKIGTNAPRSLFSLTIPAAIAKDGGDPSDIELVPLPFTAIGKAVADGQIDAGVALEPFLSGATSEFPDLTNLGDSTAYVLPEGSPSAAYFTSESIAESKAEAIAGFKTAFDKSVTYAEKNPDEVKALGGELAGIPPEVAAKLPLAPPATKVTAADLDPMLDLMVEFDWIKEKPDLTSFLGQ
ncbi:MAG: ABC transporter substrate-binding protein [Solirubrobacterales bacterium]